jgi:putative ABC transport system substrate-binding protein
MIVRRRRLIAALATCASSIAWPGRGRAQPRRRPRVAIVFNDPLSSMQGPEPAHLGIRPFLQGLRDRGWREGQEVDIERHSTEGRMDRMPELMREVATSGPDVIATVFVFDAMRATQAIPVVGVTTGAVETGLTRSLSRPDRNFTGIDMRPAVGLNAKRLQLLKEAAPAIGRVTFIDYRDSNFSKETLAAGSTLGLTLLSAGIDQPSDIESAFQMIQRQRADALLVMTTAVNFENRRRIIDFAAAGQLPAIYQDRPWAVDGGLMTYGSDSSEHWHRLAGFVDRLLRGAKPADLPIEFPNRPQLVVNRRAARAIGLSLPPAIRLQVDEFID